MQVNGANNKEHQCFLVVSSFRICTCVGIPICSALEAFLCVL